MSPRSILKQSPSHPQQYTEASLSGALPYPPTPPQVHFPSANQLAQTYPTHSNQAYDRAPIKVAPNECALPARGCPGRTYTASTSRTVHPSAAGSSKGEQGKHVHPRVVEDIRNRQQAPQQYPYQQQGASCWGPPPLIPDLSSSSESDESDGVASPPPELINNTSSVSAGAPQQLYYGHVSIASPSGNDLDKLAFLPHAGVDATAKTKERKRRSTSGTALPRFKSEDNARSFAASSLDGCLGGF